MCPVKRLRRPPPPLPSSSLLSFPPSLCPLHAAPCPVTYCVVTITTPANTAQCACVTPSLLLSSSAAAGLKLQRMSLSCERPLLFSGVIFLLLHGSSRSSGAWFKKKNNINKGAPPPVFPASYLFIAFQTWLNINLFTEHDMHPKMTTTTFKDKIIKARCMCIRNYKL